jgi:gamma-glutamylcyclotransferase (GGCT)/AIG2-like uncharacterized protein YtfP
MALNQSLQVFVYGTLKPGERSFQNYCLPYLNNQQPALAPGRIYHLPVGYPAMTLEEGWVQGVLLTFNDPQVLDPLDGLEGYYPDRPQESEYRRIRHTIYTRDRRPLTEAWLYVMTREQVDGMDGQWLPHGHWTEQRHAPERSSG